MRKIGLPVAFFVLSAPIVIVAGWSANALGCGKERALLEQWPCFLIALVALTAVWGVYRRTIFHLWPRGSERTGQTRNDMWTHIVSMQHLHRLLVATGVLLLGFAVFAWLTRSWMTYTLFFRAIGIVACAIAAVAGARALAVLRGGGQNGQRERARQTLIRSILYFTLGAGTFVAAPWIDYLYDRDCDRTQGSC